MHSKYCGIKGFVRIYGISLNYSMLTEKAKYKAGVLSFRERHRIEATIDVLLYNLLCLYCPKKKCNMYWTHTKLEFTFQLCILNTYLDSTLILSIRIPAPCSRVKRFSPGTLILIQSIPPFKIFIHKYPLYLG